MESSSALSCLAGKGAGVREKAWVRGLSEGSCQGSREAGSLGLVTGLGGPAEELPGHDRDWEARAPPCDFRLSSSSIFPGQPLSEP